MTAASAREEKKNGFRQIMEHMRAAEEKVSKRQEWRNI